MFFVRRHPADGVDLGTTTGLLTPKCARLEQSNVCRADRDRGVRTLLWLSRCTCLVVHVANTHAGRLHTLTLLNAFSDTVVTAEAGPIHSAQRRG